MLAEEEEIEGSHFGLVRHLLGCQTTYKRHFPANISYVGIALSRQNGFLRDFIATSAIDLNHEPKSGRNLLTLRPKSSKLWIDSVMQITDGPEVQFNSLLDVR